MDLHEIDPLVDHRWADLVQRSRCATIFHSPEWLAALCQTYGYEAVAFTDARPGEPLRNASVFCRIRSWITGRRLVSLPFSDHCDPLLETTDNMAAMLTSLKLQVGPDADYIEVRPRASVSLDGFDAVAGFHTHSIDLTRDLTEIYAGFHRNHVQRTIRKAERLGLRIETGCTAGLLEDFYSLHAMTRRRHGVPVQPLRWFRNLVKYFGERLTVYLSRYDGLPASAILTVNYGSALVFKYGGSNVALNRFGGSPPLFWSAIKDAKAAGLTEFDLGRSDLSNPGLTAFKNHLGAQCRSLNYYRYTRRHPSAVAHWARTVGETLYPLVPTKIQARIGSRLYGHFG